MSSCEISSHYSIVFIVLGSMFVFFLLGKLCKYEGRDIVVAISTEKLAQVTKLWNASMIIRIKSSGIDTKYQ